MKWFSRACAELARAESSSVLGTRKEEVKIGFPYLTAHIEAQAGFLSLHRLCCDDNVLW